ncbi:MAG: thiol:disulfide interchange protein DsbA/DsbL, partial [Burkholderiales bacterium]|nr:thiol:disulfide interchange protein DsbA/DsbL [Burkholderiales bacterium]
VVAVVGLAAAALLAHAEVKPGVDFDYMAQPQPTETPGKIEVIEFFWFGCPHCFKAEPAVEAWAKTLPKDVVFRREHILWEGRSDLEGHAKLFNTLRTMGLIDRMAQRVFDAIQVQHIELRDEKTLFDWIEHEGINRAQFEGIYKSFGMQAQMSRSAQLTTKYQIDGVPMFIVNGKYRTSPGKVDSNPKAPLGEVRASARALEVINELVAKERASMGGTTTTAPSKAKH